jgi:hypothetical protein
MTDELSGDIEPVRRRPVDKVYRGRTMRIVAPIYALAMLSNLIWAIWDHGPSMVSASILLAGAVIGLIRVRWPMDTWPEWLFTYKP